MAENQSSLPVCAETGKILPRENIVSGNDWRTVVCRCHAVFVFRKIAFYAISVNRKTHNCELGMKRIRLSHVVEL